MNRKKLIITLVLIITMIVCNSISAYAINEHNGNDEGTNTKETTWDGSTYTGDSNTQNVTATYTKAASSTCYVTITWGSLKYKYDGQISWDGQGKYNGQDSVTTWNVSSDEDKKITVDNRSDVKVKATFSFAEDGNYIDTTASSLTATVKANGTTDITSSFLGLGTAADAESGARIGYGLVDIHGVPKGIKPVVDAQTVDLEDEGVPVGNVTVTLETY